MASAGAAPRAATGPMAPRHLLACILRAVAAAGAGLVLAIGVGLVIWAVTPESGSPWTVVRGSIAGWGAANFLPPTIGGIVITLPPLLLTAVTAGLVASAANRGRRDGAGPVSELLGGVVVGLVHGAVVTGVVTAMAPSGAENVGRGWAPVLLGVVSALLAVVLRGAAWRDPATTAVPWLRAGLRAGLGGLLLMLAGGAAAVAVGLIGGFGMLQLGLAFLPNALIVGTAYTVGVGFQIGTGTYSPLGAVGADLPAVPLLAAVPDSGGLSWPGVATAVFPLLAAVLIGRRMIRSVDTRRERMAGALVAAVVAGIGLSLLALVAGGGIRGSDWATIVVPALGVLAVTTVVLAVVGAAVAGVAGWGAVSWSGTPGSARQTQPAAEQDTDPELDTDRESDPDPDTDPESDPDQVAEHPNQVAGADQVADPDQVADTDPESDPDQVADPDPADGGDAPADGGDAPVDDADADESADEDDDSGSDLTGSTTEGVIDGTPADPPAGDQRDRH